MLLQQQATPTVASSLPRKDTPTVVLLQQQATPIVASSLPRKVTPTVVLLQQQATPTVASSLPRKDTPTVVLLQQQATPTVASSLPRKDTPTVVLLQQQATPIVASSLPRKVTPTVVLLQQQAVVSVQIQVDGHTTINIDRLRRTNVWDEGAMMKVPGRLFWVRLRTPLVDLFQARRITAYIYGTFERNSASSLVSPPGDVVDRNTTLSPVTNH